MIVYLLCFVLFLVGLYGVLVKRDLVKIILALGIQGYAINLLKKPLNGGMPEIESEATIEVNDVVGIIFVRFPSLRKSRVPVTVSTAPAL